MIQGTGKKLGILAAALLAVLTVFGFATLAHANPFYAGSKAQSATATSTQTFMRVGFATSTTVYDSYEQGGTNQTNTGNLTIPDTVVFALDGRASTTASVISAVCEYSDNWNASTGNGDWYQNELTVATTTNPVWIGPVASFAFTYSSSTVKGAAPDATFDRFQKLVTCPVPTRWVRLVVTNSGSPASVWVQAIPKKQRNSN